MEKEPINIHNYYGMVFQNCDMPNATFQTINQPTGNVGNEESSLNEGRSTKGGGCRPGRPRTPIFNEGVDTERLAAAVRRIHDTHYRPASGRVEVDDEQFDETDFLLSLYYVFVKRGISPSELAAKPYYAFLTEACGIRPQQGEKTFVNHLNKVVRTGKDFHRLTPDLLAAETREGVMTPRELPRWQRMFAAAEEAVENYYEGEEE